MGILEILEILDISAVLWGVGITSIYCCGCGMRVEVDANVEAGCRFRGRMGILKDNTVLFLPLLVHFSIPIPISRWHHILLECVDGKVCKSLISKISVSA